MKELLGPTWGLRLPRRSILSEFSTTAVIEEVAPTVALLLPILFVPKKSNKTHFFPQHHTFHNHHMSIIGKNKNIILSMLTFDFPTLAFELDERQNLLPLLNRRVD